MKTAKLLSVIIAAALPLSAYAFSPTCADKEKQIMTELRYAQNHGNRHRIIALETALDNVRNHCTNAGLKSEAKEKMLDQERKVAKAQREVDAVVREGRSPSKVAKKRSKLDREIYELNQLKREYNAIPG